MSGEDRSGAACARCGTRCADPTVLALHRGRAHAGQLDEAERAAFEAALEDEAAWMRAFRGHVAGALGAALVVLAYLGAVLPAVRRGGNPALMALPLPGILIFAAVTYWQVSNHRQRVEAREDEADDEDEDGDEDGPGGKA